MFDSKKTAREVHEAADAKIFAALDRGPEFDEEVYDQNKRLINACRLKRLRELGAEADTWIYQD